MNERKIIINKRLAPAKAIELAFVIIGFMGFITIGVAVFALESAIVLLLGFILILVGLIVSCIAVYIQKQIIRNIVKSAQQEEYTHEKLDDLLDQYDSIREVLKDANFAPIAGTPTFISKYEYGGSYPANMKDRGLVLIDESKKNIAIFTEATGFNIIPVNNIKNIDFQKKIIEKEKSKEDIKEEYKANAALNVAGAISGVVTGIGVSKFVDKYNYIIFLSIKLELENPQEFSSILQNEKYNFFIPTSRILFARVIPEENDEVIQNAGRVAAFIKHYTAN